MEETKLDANKLTTIDKVTKFIPIIYPILVYLGFYKYDFYYKFYSIDIFNYLSVFEILFSFLSLINSIIIILCLNVMVFHFFPKELIHKFKSRKKINYNLAFIFLVICVFIFTPISQISMERKNYGYSLYIIESYGYYIYAGLVLMTLLIFITYFELTKDYFFSINNIFFKMCIVIILTLMFISTNQSFSFYNVIKKESIMDVNFTYNNKFICTDSDKIFIGKTAHYLFLRNIEDSTNDIFKMDEITNLQMKKIK